MDKLVHTSLSALRGAMARQAATANNLANANTTGFRGEIANARALWLEGGAFASRAQASEEVLAADMHAGAVTETGRDLDVAMDGDALLWVANALEDERFCDHPNVTGAEGVRFYAGAPIRLVDGVVRATGRSGSRSTDRRPATGPCSATRGPGPRHLPAAAATAARRSARAPPGRGPCRSRPAPSAA